MPETTVETTQTAAACPWTPRSRESIREEEALVKDLTRCLTLVGLAADGLKSLSGDKERLLQNMKEGEAWADNALTKTLQQIDIAERRQAVFKEEWEAAQAKLDGFRSREAAFAPERAETQRRIADEATALLEIDGEIENHLQAALEMLERRKALTDEMQRQAASIGLPMNMDNGVYEALRLALSMELVSATREWKAVLLGEAENLRPFVVVDDKQFEPEETLARKPVFTFGEIVYLSELEARMLLMTTRPHPHAQRGWECLPATLMRLEEFRAAEAESGSPQNVRWFLRKKFEEAEQDRRKAWLLTLKGSRLEGVQYSD